MFSTLFRKLYKTYHLVNVKPVPPSPIFYTPRGLPVQQRNKPLEELKPFALSLTNPVPLSTIIPIPNSRYPSRIKEKREVKTVLATRKYLRTSVAKLRGITRVIKKRHIEDALNVLGNIRKKPVIWVTNILKAGIRSAVNIKGMSEDRLYIQRILLGKNTGIRGIRYKAKGRSSMMHRPKSQVTIILEEKTPEEIYGLIMNGKFTRGVAMILRSMAIERNSSYKEIRDIQNLLTAKGRQQQKLMFDRRIEIIYKKKLEEGLVLDRKVIEEDIIKEESKKFASDYWEHKRAEAEKQVAERLEVFNKNQKA